MDVNARCLEDVDLDALATSRFDGRNWRMQTRERERAR